LDSFRDKVADMSVTPDELAAAAVAELSGINTGRKAKSNRQVAREILEDQRKPLPVYSTGLAPLDAAMGGGLIAGKLYGFGARMKIGKTLLSGSISYNLNKAEVPHLYIALEMSDHEIEHRNIARDQRFNSIKFVTRDMADLENRIAEYANTTPECTFYEHAPGASLNELRGIVGRNRSLGIRGVIVDYLQLVTGKGKDTEEAHLRNVAQWMADTARQTGLWFITAAQLNQEDNVRGGEGLKLAADQYYIIHRERNEATGEWIDSAWLTMEQTRYTLYQSVGTQSRPALWLDKRGPHFSDTPPSYRGAA
jgi:replicative DNA helicase